MGRALRDPASSAASESDGGSGETHRLIPDPGRHGTAGRPLIPSRPRGRRPFAPVAALDLGTNNCRLLVARPIQDGFRVIDAFSRIVRLGEGLGQTGILSEAAMARTLSALDVCMSKMVRRGVLRSRAVATEACRRAANFDVFHECVESRFGLDLEVISPAEEARLALQGCAPLLTPGRPYAVMFDIGGGSTEVLWLRTDITCGHAWPMVCPQLIDSVSLPFGVVTLSEQHGGHAVTADAFDAMKARAAAAIAVLERRNDISGLIEAGQVQMLGSSGTVTTVAGIALDLPRYDRARVDGIYLDFVTARQVTQRLLETSYEGRCAFPCVGRQRGDLVLAGCAILEALLDQWPVGRLRIADRGVREGILVDLCDTPASGGDGDGPAPASFEAQAVDQRP